MREYRKPSGEAVCSHIGARILFERADPKQGKRVESEEGRKPAQLVVYPPRNRIYAYGYADSRGRLSLQVKTNRKEKIV